MRKKRSLQISGLFGKHKDSYTVNPNASPRATRKLSVPSEMPVQVMYYIRIWYVLTLTSLHIG